jgi:hypothetical protein
MNASEKTTFKFVALSNGERAAGIPPSNISIEVSIDDVGFEDFRSEFVDDFKKFIKTWMDGARIYTQEEVDKLSREEREHECDECNETIPVVDGGGLANRHHKESCSLFDSSQE